MQQVPVRRLNQDTAAVLARVEAGETVEVTRNGRPVARIVPLTLDPVRELVDAGIIRPPSSHLDLRLALNGPANQRDSADWFSQDREDRF